MGRIFLLLQPNESCHQLCDWLRQDGHQLVGPHEGLALPETNLILLDASHLEALSFPGLSPKTPRVLVASSQELQALSDTLQGRIDEVLRTPFTRFEARLRLAPLLPSECVPRHKPALWPEHLWQWIPDLVYRLQMQDDGSVVFREVSDSFVRLTGYSRQEVLDRGGWQILVEPQDLPVVQQHMGQLFLGKPDEKEFRIIAKDGQVRWLRSSAQPRIEQGKVLDVVGVLRDITTQRRTTQPPWDKDSSYRSLVENASDAIFITNAQGDLQMVNLRACEITGYNRRELLLMNFRQLCSPDSQDAEVFPAAAFEDGRPSFSIRLLRRKDGSYFSAELSCKRLQDGRLQAIVRDRSETLQRRELFWQASDTLRALVWAAPLAIVRLDLQGRVTLWNPAAERILGWTESEAQGRVLPFIEADKLAQLQALLNQVAQGDLFGTEKELPACRKDGQKITISFCAAPLSDATGRVYGVMFIGQDITAKKNAEEALRSAEARRRAMLSALPDQMFMIRKDGCIIDYYSPTPEQLYVPPDQIVGHFLAELMPPITAQQSAEYLNKALSEGTIQFYQYCLNMPSGQRHFEARMVPYAETEVLTMVRDITEQRHLEEQLRQAVKMEAVGQLAGGVAHDFNNLLTTIIGYSEMLLGDLIAGDPCRDDIEEIRKAAERAASLTQQLLAFSRKQMLEPTVLDLRSTVSELQKMLHRLLGEDIELIIRSDSQPTWVKADQGQIQQVLMNLVVNARDAMPTGGKLIIEALNIVLDQAYSDSHFDLQPGPYAMLAVSDTGVGMTESVRSRIFEPFFSTKERGKGTGLGLSTVYGIVRQSGGQIFVYSEAGQGSTFKVYLPSAAHQAKVRPPSLRMSIAPVGIETILLVEDEEAVRALARRVLESQGYLVLTASDADHALQISQQYRGAIDLLLTDVIMPRLSGRQLAEKLIVDRNRVKVLYMSGYTDDAIVHHGLLDSQAAFIQKPFSPLILAKKVREVLDRRPEP